MNTIRATTNACDSNFEGAATRVVGKLALCAAVMAAGCASAPPGDAVPVQTGLDTYYVSARTTSNPEALIGPLIATGNKFCAQKGRQFELIDRTANKNVWQSFYGVASVTFKCNLEPTANGQPLK